ncbi:MULTISPECIES: PstS family phosphate ABC transporter substrate-binding protein [unclassified Candidatus Frackibacter]|uniref:PstS family phosphate ABC transporter substrate-binding protein n=1 Tax=unclassified Candidatus Frackibacter TaxID=2648818 RepID=UPI0007961AC6|nr:MULTISPECIES: PstS family phosphate ABC transporter substrate-binding protein [unclassified Candidatus Frackibacter]KXS45084.1 MAG: phosphate transport system substrate-binding protein [Candidatus Frackibacter sp. T328-2]SDB96607.1 phosphate ABC transporter substrate-binding protein, PhoT family [Candidatus Frackibacter sp. WG11]SEM28091.1 phosphate ABC transporter substrate-binding protein, PhoT family [Candidatus Frackibacter sp. WG12]SFL32947.1 phosphate ABC transporter substrate-binding 
MGRLLNKRAIILVSILTMAGLFLVGCGGAQNQGEGQQGYVQVKGSDTMVNMVQVLAEEYMAQNEGVSLSVTGGGSGTGIAALINDKVDIANSSRVMKEEEIKQAEANGVDVKRFVVAMDGLSVIVHESNPVENLTVDQIGDIFKGEITNWKEVGGLDKEISLYGRQSNSGTFVYFRNNVLKGDYSANMKRMNGNAQIVEGIKADEAGIGYVGIGYVVNDNDKEIEGLNILNVAKDANSKPASPLKPENVKTGDYPLARPLNQYTNGVPTGQELEFIKYELSDEGQAIAVEQGFYPVSPKFKKINEKNLGK